MTWEMWKRRLGEILIKFSTKTRKLINDLQKSDCYGLNGEQKKFSQVPSHPWHVSSYFCPFLEPCQFIFSGFSTKQILRNFSIPRGIAISVPFPEVRSRKGTVSGLPGTGPVRANRHKRNRTLLENWQLKSSINGFCPPSVLKEFLKF